MEKKCIKMYRFSRKNYYFFKIITVVYFAYFRQTIASDFFIAKQYDNNKYVCVTNSSYPMSWIQEEIKFPLSFASASFFIPGTNSNNFDSTISVRDLAKSRFALSSWSFPRPFLAFELIFDRRWEGLDTYMTEFVDKKNSYLKYQQVIQTITSDFKILLSIRLKQEGHIFLCDGYYPPNSNCYWLMLQAWSGKKSAIRKCDAGYIPSQHEKWVQEPCSNILTEFNHENKPDSLYFSNKKWSHLKITKIANILSLFSVNNNEKEKIILNLEDKDPIAVTHMIIHSKQFNGLWKIHKFDVIYTEQESSRIHLGNPIYPQDKYLCINLFISMCTYCTLTLTLEDYENNVIKEKVYKHSPGWSEIKFTTKNIRQLNNPIKFLVSTSSSSPDRFWAIDDIRICRKKEFRAISLSENAKCQLMSKEDNVISILSGTQRLNSSCPENTIGDFCVPCKWVYNSCKRIEVCQEDRCVCSAGYKSYYSGDYECYRKCDSSYYGHGCLKQCPNCLNSTCNNIDGACNYQGQCVNEYTGPKCDTPGKPFPMSHPGLLGLLVLLFIPIAVILYIKRHKIISVKESIWANNHTSTEALELNEIHIDLSQNVQLQDKITKQHDHQNCTHMSSKVETKNFYNYVKTTESCGELKRQHKIIMETLTPYDVIFENFQVEYIDVNYIDGHQSQKVYIATQRPKKSEINRFWKIIWDENVHHIVLYDFITNNGHKLNFEQYWPEQNEDMQLENIFIKCNASKKYQFYTCRTFTVTFNNREKQVEQLHFSSNNLTEYLSTIKYVDFFQAISNIPLDTNSPILIHSSYGISENCFVLLCDISLRLSRRDGVVDVMNNLKQLSEVSSQLIVDYNHYLLAHRTILEGLLYTKTSINCDSSQNYDYIIPISPQERDHLKYLQKTWWLDCTSTTDRHTRTDQIRKISIDGFKSGGKFLVISHPSKNTIHQFWKQIEDENISLIISVNGDVSVYLHKEISSMQLSSGIIIKTINIITFETFEWITVKMNNHRNIEIFSMKNWPAKRILPENVSDFVNFCKKTNEVLNKHKSIAVTCHDGLTAAGLYITMSYNIQKIKTEGVSDICTCIRLIRSQCQYFFRKKIQYKFLMEATHMYANQFGLYEEI